MELVKANADQIKEATKNIPIEGQRLIRAVELLFSQTVKTAQETNNLNMTEQIISQTVKKLKAETTLLDNQAAAEQALDNLGREVKQAQPIIDVIKPFIRR
jgi:cell division protein FtsB